MNLLFVYRYLNLGGVETLLQARLERLPSLGIEAGAWFLHDGPGRRLFHRCRERICVGSVDELAQRLARGDVDLVSTIDTEEVFPLFEDGHGTKLAVECHSTYLENLHYLTALHRLPVAGVLVPSRHQAALVRRLAGTLDVRVVANPIGPRFVAGLSDDGVRPGRPIVCWIGRLDEQKDWQGLLESTGYIEREAVNAEYWLIASAHEPRQADRLREEASRQGVLGRLRWLQSLPHERVPLLFDLVRRSGGVVLSTSRDESFGLSVAEGMARACAVVVPEVGALTELVEHQASGLCYPAGSTGVAATQVAELIQDDDERRRLGQSARQTVLERFAPEAAMRALAGELMKM